MAKKVRRKLRKRNSSPVRKRNGAGAGVKAGRTRRMNDLRRLVQRFGSKAKLRAALEQL